MATSSGHKSPLIIDKLSDIDFQAEVEIICNYLRWESFPKRSTENFMSILERRAQTFCVEEYVPTDADDASSALSVSLQLFYTGSAESTGDEHVEDPVEAAELPQVDGCKRLVISHPRLQLNILNTVHTGQEGSNMHLSVHEMWKKIIPVYYWRNIGTSIIEFIKNCEMCKLQDKGPKTDLPAAPLTSTSNSENGSSRDTEMEMEDDHDDSFESFQLSNEVPYHEEVSQIYDYLKTGKYPPNGTPNFKRGLRRRARQYVLAEDDTDGTNIGPSKKLYFVKAQERKTNQNAGNGSERGVEVYMRLVVSVPEEQQKILQIAHIGASGEHCGRDKMVDSLTKLYFWKGLYRSVMVFLENCSECQTKRTDAQKRSFEQSVPKQDVWETPRAREAAKGVKREGVITRSRNSLATRREHFNRRTGETFNYLKYHTYPPNSTCAAKRDIRRRSLCFTIGRSEAEEWPDICGCSDPQERLYYLKKFRKPRSQEEDDDDDDDDGGEDDDDQGQAERPVRRLVLTSEEEQNNAITKVHVDENGIHNSRLRTLHRVAEHYYWVDMKTTVNEYIDNCSCTSVSQRRVPQEHIEPSRDRLALNRFSIKPQKIILVPPPEVKPKPPIPQELTELPKGLSHISGLDTEVEALVLYLYLKWQKYPPECTDGFKRTVRKKANAFFVHEESGEDNESNWCLYYKGDLNKDPRDTGQVVEVEEITGDVTSKESAAYKEVGEMEETDQAMEITGSKETKDTRETDRALQTLEIREGVVTEEMDSAVTTKSKVIRKERSMDYRTRHKLYVYRKPDQQKILQYVHLHGGRNGRHAGRDKISSVISRHFFWRGYKDDILMILTKCKICQMKRTANGGMEYNLYLQKLDRDGIQNGYEDAFEDHSTHTLPLQLQAYLKNAMSMEAGWEAEDLAPRQGPLSNLNSSGSLREGDQTVRCQEGEGATEQVRLTDGVLSSFNYQGGDSCPQRFRDRDSLQRHKQAKHISRPSIKCTFCTKVFKRSEDLSAHMRCHTKEKPYECEYCKKPFRYRSGLTHHRKLHFGFKPFACPECPLRFVSRGDFNMHFKSAHEGRGDYLCDICGKSFATPVRLKMHKKIHMESRQRFICNICGKVLATSTTFKYHMYIHTGERHILCELCGKGFKKKDELNKHMRRHMGIKPYQCHICQQRFSLKGDLHDHIRGHEGASLYQCEVCDKRFKNKRSMARCKRKHAQASTEEGFPCNTCGEVLGTLIDFALHREAHVGAQIIRQEVVIE